MAKELVEVDHLAAAIVQPGIRAGQFQQVVQKAAEPVEVMTPASRIREPSRAWRSSAVDKSWACGRKC
jgi:hypothetical protein